MAGPGVRDAAQMPGHPAVTARVTVTESRRGRRCRRCRRDRDFPGPGRGQLEGPATKIITESSFQISLGLG